MTHQELETQLLALTPTEKAQSQRLHEAISQAGNLAGKLIRVVHPSI